MSRPKLPMCEVAASGPRLSQAMPVRQWPAWMFSFFVVIHTAAQGVFLFSYYIIVFSYMSFSFVFINTCFLQFYFGIVTQLFFLLLW